MTVYIAHQANKFVQQKEDYDWLVKGCPGGQGVDSFDERVVYTTFASDLAKPDFEEYIDRKFSDLSDSNQKKIKALYKATRDVDLEKNIYFDYEPNGTISATLTMMLFERAGGELRVSVGYIKYIRKPSQGYHFNVDYWQSNTDKVVRGLQYKYGVELQRELQ